MTLLISRDTPPRSPGIHAGKEILAKPGNDDHERTKASCKKSHQKGQAMMQAALQQAAICLAETLEPGFELLLKPDEEAGARIVHLSRFLK